MTYDHSRRKFIKLSACFGGVTIMGGLMPQNIYDAGFFNDRVPISGHLWLYASQYPPDWDCTPILEQVFSDFKYAGMEGVEVMESIVRHKDAVPRMKGLIEKYGIPVTGCSYYGDMWDRSQQQEILEDIEFVVERLHEIGASTFGITVGDAGHVKTEDELDSQAEILQKVLKVCDKNKIQPNLHNHTFEVANDMHDLKGTLKRIPDINLGPDFNWLVRAGIDPVWFIKKYGHQMVYCHIRDQDAQGKWTHAVGEGVTDFPAIAKALKNVGFTGRAAIELAFEEPPEGPVKDDWKKSRKYVKQVFGW